MLILLTCAALIAARVLWQRKPGLLTCSLFWATSVANVSITWYDGVSHWFIIAGIACNSLVTLANGGFMPVAAHWKARGPAHSAWVQKESGQRLLWLADNFGNRWIRFSVGDALLLVGVILFVAGS
jgi:hypothetical protein